MTTATDAIPNCLSELRTTNPVRRLAAVRTLGKLGIAALPALPNLVQSLNDNDAKIREATAQAICECGPQALLSIVRMLSHSDKYVRRHAVWGLAKLGLAAKPVLADLCRALRDEDPRTASGAAQAIGNMGAESAPAVSALAEAMRGTNIVLCRLAAKALSQIGPAALTTLVTHLKHHDPFVRGEAAVAIGWMGPQAAGAVQPLIEIVRAKRARKMQPSVSGLLGRSTTSTPPAPREEASDLQTEETTRINAITALGRIGPDAITSLPYLQDAIEDSSDTIRRVAELAIRQVQGVE